MNRYLKAFGLLPVVALALAGCGSSAGSSSSSSAAAPAKTATSPAAYSSGGASGASSASTSASTGSAATGQQAVTIKNYAYMPATVTVAPGTKITWTNEDSSNHTVTADNGSFDLGNLNDGQSKSMVFTKPGTYHYHCSYHPFMHGTVIVK